ncbi:DinI-like family protein, partial [Salmonella enterica]|uniref:DinI-like family protein n=1 Tax=Salmonella enterica TaxID=28901 RepID=UPI000ABB0AC2
MRIEVTIAKTSPLPAGAIDALAGGISPPISPPFSENFGNVTPRYATAHKFSVIGASKEDKKSTNEDLPGTWGRGGDRVSNAKKKIHCLLHIRHRR